VDEERAAKLDEMVQRAMSKAYTPPMTPVELELPPMSGHKAPEGSN
jgi:thiamine pyrophosphate-dependent acetolactate synthase large subunit-like protein